MARIRSLHPGLFTDEAFMGISMPARILLMGLWTESDDNGVFEWKPLTLKVRVMPADAVDVSALLDELQAANVIMMYAVNEHKFGVVRNFCKYQRPRKPQYKYPVTREAELYAAKEPAVPQKSEPVQTETGKPPQREDVGCRMEEGGNRKETKSSTTRECEWPRDFEERFWSAYPKRVDKKAALRKLGQVWKSDQVPWPSLIAAVNAYAAACVSRDPQFVKSPEVWLNKGCWEDESAAVSGAALSKPEHGPAGAKFYAGPETREIEAWDAYFKQTRGRPTPRDSRGGWLVDSQWPPESPGVAA